MKRIAFIWALVLAVLWSLSMIPPALAAYSAHQNDTDINNFLAVYPFAKSTKLDDCALCHPGSGSSGSCDYCHTTYKLSSPHGAVPLNAYGQAYRDADAKGGPNYRTQQAIREIQNDDSDLDGYSNFAEIQALFFPGNPLDHPGLTPAPAISLNLERILQLPSYSEFLLLNASKSQDFYARYSGVKIMDLLKYAGVSKKATQITVFSPDGFSQTFPIGGPTGPKSLPYNVMGPYPYETYYGGLGFVDYSFIPFDLEKGNKIPGKLYMLLAYLRDGDPLTIGKLIPSTTKPGTLTLDGEGPYRLIPPQKIAGGPDRPSTASPSNPPDGWDYDANKDHNAGYSARTVAAIRVEPLPAGTTDFNWYEGGWNLVDHAKLVIYGAIDPRTYSVGGEVTDGKGNGIPGVKVTFGLMSLGQVGEVTTSADKGHLKKRLEGGKFSTDLPAGEYTVIPSKDGCTFTPASLSISISDAECDQDRDHWDPWARWEHWEQCNCHPGYEINITGSCTQ